MKSSQIDARVLAAASGMLQPFYPELNPQRLLEFLESIGAKSRETGKTGNLPEKPLSRAEAATLLGVTLNTLNRYMNRGLLRRVKVGPRIVRINPEDVRNLLTPEARHE